jgi:flagellar basal-body rod protein FlgB
MLERLFGGDRLQALYRALDTAAVRHQTIAHNLANANTPGYKRQIVQFETELSRALDRSRKTVCRPGESPVAQVRPRIVTLNNTSTRTDGNNVNLETEGVEMAINTFRYAVFAQSVGGYFDSLKSVISGGR